MPSTGYTPGVALPRISCQECGEETRLPRGDSPRPQGLCYNCWRETDDYREYNRGEKRRAYQEDGGVRERVRGRAAARYRAKAQDPTFLEQEAARKRDSSVRRRDAGTEREGSGSRGPAT